MTIRNTTENQVKIKWVCYSFLSNYLYIDYILVLRHPGGGDRSDRNMLVKNNNVWLDIFINVHLLVYHLSRKLIATNTGHRT